MSKGKGWERRPPPSTRDYEKELWMGVCIAVTRAKGSTDVEVSTSWADYALEKFKNKFKED